MGMGGKSGNRLRLGNMWTKGGNSHDPEIVEFVEGGGERILEEGTEQLHNHTGFNIKGGDQDQSKREMGPKGEKKKQNEASKRERSKAVPTRFGRGGGDRTP